MPNLRLPALLASCVALSHAAQVKFVPDTVCAGNKRGCEIPSTTMVAMGSQRIAIRPHYLISPYPTGTELVFQQRNVPSTTVWSTTHSTRIPPNGYLHKLEANISQSDTMRLNPGDSLMLSNFKFGLCLLCPAVLARTTPTTLSLGLGERVALLFGTDSTRLDTLWAIASEWFVGGTLSRAIAPGKPQSPTSHDALGRQWTTGTAATIEFAPTGSSLPEKP